MDAKRVFAKPKFASRAQAQPTEGAEGAKVGTPPPIQTAAVIVIESLDPLARDVIIQSVLIKQCIDADILLFTANTGETVCDAFLTDPIRKASANSGCL